MQSYIWLASIFGPFLFFLGIWGLFYRDNMMKVVTAIKANAGLFYLFGAARLWLGLVMINSYGVWAFDWLVLVTLLGWVFVVSGLGCLFLPQLMFKMMGRDYKGYTIRAAVSLVWGFLLCWIAFWS